MMYSKTTSNMQHLRTFESGSPGGVRIALAQHRSLDCIALATLFRSTPNILLLGSVSLLEELVELCREKLPEVAIIDAMFSEGVAFEAATDLLENRYVQNVLFLDDKIRVSNANRAMGIPGAGYLTKESSIQEIQKALEKLIAGEDVFDSVLQRKYTSKAREKKQHLRFDTPVLAKLSPREIQVMKLMAVGNSVRDTARRLDLAPSTIDNHKSRLMRKLGIHKAAELTRIAMREGLIE